MEIIFSFTLRQQVALANYKKDKHRHTTSIFNPHDDRTAICGPGDVISTDTVSGLLEWKSNKKKLKKEWMDSGENKLDYSILINIKKYI